LFIHVHKFTFRPLCLHSITKILRNGPRAHFPFMIPPKVKDEEAPKGGLQRKINVDSAESKRRRSS
jgi:hypothetical protein